jgi:hypothetical protein
MDDLPFLSGLNNVTSSIPELLPPEDLDLDRCQLLGPVALIVQVIASLLDSSYLIDSSPIYSISRRE